MQFFREEFFRRNRVAGGTVGCTEKSFAGWNSAFLCSGGVF